MNQTQEAQTTFDQWCIVELLGHVRVAGRVTEEEHFGAKLGRVDIPDGNDGFVTQFFGGASVYRLTPTTEAIARQVAVRNIAPVSPWELRQPELPAGRTEVGRDYDDGERYDDESIGDENGYDLPRDPDDHPEDIDLEDPMNDKHLIS